MKKRLSIIFGLLAIILFLRAARAPEPDRPTGSSAAPAATAAPQGPASPRVSAVRAAIDYGRMPLYFIANKGQVDEQVAYYVQGADKTLHFTSEGVTFILTGHGEGKRIAPVSSLQEPSRALGGERERAARTRDDPGASDGQGNQAKPEAASAERWVVKLDFVGANRDVRPVGQDGTGAVVSYFSGQPKDWHAGVPTYSKIVYPNLWPGIDLAYSGTVNKLKYEFVVHPGADPSLIRLAYRGATDVKINPAGRLEVSTPSGGFQDDAPVAYQEKGGNRVAVPMAYRLLSDGAAAETGKRAAVGECPSASSRGGRAALAPRGYGFEVGDYDATQPLVLDPAVFVYCGFVGGSAAEDVRGITVDGSGNAYIVGKTTSSSTGFPIVVGPDLTPNGSGEVFVAKVNAAGTGLVYCGYIGGSQTDTIEGFGHAIAVDSQGCAYVVGSTNSDQTTFPILVGPDLTQNGNLDAFVAKIKADGTGLAYCGYIGGAQEDTGWAIAVDGSGCAYVTGQTYSDETTFPVAVGPRLTSYQEDAFVAKVKADGTGLVYCGFIGGYQYEYGDGIAVDSTGAAYVVGTTQSTESQDFPVTVGPDLTYNGGTDAFIAKVRPDGTGFVYCGYIGGAAGDGAADVAVDAAGNAYVGGTTSSDETTFPVNVGPDVTFNNTAGYQDGFVARVKADGTGLVYCGYIGGAATDGVGGIALDGSGCLYICGVTGSTQATFPVSGGPDLTHNGGGDAFVGKVKADGTGLIYCGYIGGSALDGAAGIAVDGSGNAYVTGQTYSTEATFPVLVGPDLTANGNTDVFVAKISAYDPPPLVFGGHDFDGNGSSDIAIYRPTDGVWYVRNGISQPWGAPGDIPVQGYYDFNATTDIAVWRPSNGVWYVMGISIVQWGMAGDLPVPHDYNGDGATDIAVWRPSNGVWYINGGGVFQWGRDGDYPVPGDYNGDNVDEIAVWRPENGVWYVKGVGAFQWGAQGDIPVPADYDGDGIIDLAVYRPSTGIWYIKSSGDGGITAQWGSPGDVPVPGDYDGNGTTDIAVFRPSNGVWYIRGDGLYQWGQVGDTPLVR